MRAAILLLVGVAILAVALRTVGIRTEIVREGYLRGRLERNLREERERIQALEAEIAAASSPLVLLASAKRLGIALAERAPDQIVVARRAERKPALLARR